MKQRVIIIKSRLLHEHLGKVGHEVRGKPTVVRRYCLRQLGCCRYCRSVGRRRIQPGSVKVRGRFVVITFLPCRRGSVIRGNRCRPLRGIAGIVVVGSAVLESPLLQVVQAAHARIRLERLERATLIVLRRLAIPILILALAL